MIQEVKSKAFLDLKFRQTEAGVIRTLLYFDIFQYPLTLDEIIKFHTHRDSSVQIARAINDLLNRSIIYKQENFYSLHTGDSLAKRRKAGNELAQKKLETAKKFSALISKFPFTRAVMLSGSLSKDFMEKDSDIDYFIITEPGRLWVVRGMLALFKRVFLFNSHKFFCTNYLIDSKSLEIEEKNIYTAVETATLIPVYGELQHRKFIANNHWVKDFLPYADFSRNAYIYEKSSIVKNFLERIFSGSLGERLDVLLMNKAINRWRKQFGHSFSPAEFDLAFKSRRNVSKNHPRFFQKQILNRFQDKIESFEVLNNIKLSA